MSKKAALITVHGMGKTELGYADELFDAMRGRLGAAADELHFGRAYYQDLLQDNEDRVWDKVKDKVRWSDLREFLLFGFADAAGLENAKEKPRSVYLAAQIRIAQELFRARGEVGNGPVVVLAQSLGCHVISCYYWDAKDYAASLANPAERPQAGLWQDPQSHAGEVTGGGAFAAGDLEFIGGATLQAFFTTGCNIPIFVAAHSQAQILPYTRPGFVWHNYYDKDDVLGWPLADLSPEYGAVVQDHAVNAGGGFFDWLVKSWNPLSHEQYWGDDDVLDPLEAFLRPLL